MFEELNLPGANISIHRTFIEKGEAIKLFRFLVDNAKWRQEYFKTIPLPRLTAWYGDPGTTYVYSGITNEPEPWIPEIMNLKKDIEERGIGNYNSVLLNYYKDGRGSIGWHSDNEKGLGPNPIIASISLGGNRDFLLRNKTTKEVTSITLNNGSLLLMGKGTQINYEHSIQKIPQAFARINLTFRWVY